MSFQKEIVVLQNLTELMNFRQTPKPQTPVISRDEGSGVISPLCSANMLNDTASEKQNCHCQIFL